MIERNPKVPPEAKKEFMTAIAAEFEDFKQGLVLKGKAEGKAEIVIGVLTARGIPLPGAARTRILSCTDEDQLMHWALRAYQVQSADELIAS